MSRKSLSQKKRHTKPCKYFQVNKCPHPADVCDFAHVLVNPTIGSPVGHGLAVCRFYYGQCMNGPMCTCKRASGATLLTQEAPAAVGLYSDQLWSPTSVDANYSESPPPMYTGFSSFSPTWPPSATYPMPTLFSPVADSVLRNMSSRSRDSIGTTATSHSMDSADSVVTTEDPQYSEHQHDHQSQICVIDDSPVIHVPPFQPFPYINTAVMQPTPHGYYGHPRPRANESILPPSLKSRTKVSKQKALKYKTKPCKFFPTERGCPNGAACNFIHDEPHLIAALGDKDTKEDLPKEETARKNFVPIPWRVIGGGVLVGVQKEEDSDVSDEGESLNDSQTAKSKKPAVGPLKIVSRKRSNSIPPTPSTTQVMVEQLFSSAESPGVL
ncbi:hypothetical protein D9613_005971 [Agrocybe pediades]|uniref:C3H1-type domain-containing protein n=1 Tax=Agrocybe pediades TaxID=84607 RepID=A0A8H4QVH7_9AGAR|nr:hypothetical protein D9613_005971 [Agrocybe pediades]KAF9562598.1 hypothetical protein CPC08DRAFT_374092 [Agrocybe pediades]